MTYKVTPRQRQLLLLIRDFTRKNGYPPSRRELLLELGAASTNTVTCLLKSLEKNKLVLIAPKISRGITLTDQGNTILGLA